MTRVILPKMVSQGGGVIVNVSSFASTAATPQYTVYSASKVCGTASVQLKHSNIFVRFRVNVLFYGWQIFVNYISDGLRKEYGHKGITVQVDMATLIMEMHYIKSIFQNVEPLFVATSMTGNRGASYFIPSPTSATKAAVATIGIQNSTNGCFPHALQVSL